jgi:hypothetical protein
MERRTLLTRPLRIEDTPAAEGARGLAAAAAALTRIEKERLKSDAERRRVEKESRRQTSESRTILEGRRSSISADAERAVGVLLVAGGAIVLVVVAIGGVLVLVEATGELARGEAMLVLLEAGAAAVVIPDSSLVPLTVSDAGAGDVLTEIPPFPFLEMILEFVIEVKDSEMLIFCVKSRIESSVISSVDSS